MPYLQKSIVTGISGVKLRIVLAIRKTLDLFEYDDQIPQMGNPTTS